MNNKPLFSFALSLITSAFVLVQAQPPKPPSMEARLKRLTNRVDKELALNATQKQQLIVAYQSFFVAIDDLHAKQSPPPPPPPANKVAVDKLVAARDEKIKAVLSAEQFSKYISVEKELRPKHQGMHDNRNEKMHSSGEKDN